MASEISDSIHAAAANLAQERVLQIEGQFNAQAEEWNRRERAMLEQQELLVHAMAELNAKLDASERQKDRLIGQNQQLAAQGLKVAEKFPASKKHHKKFAGHNPGIRPPRITRSAANIRRPIELNQGPIPPPETVIPVAPSGIIPPPNPSIPTLESNIPANPVVPNQVIPSSSHTRSTHVDYSSPVSNRTRSHGPAPPIPELPHTRSKGAKNNSGDKTVKKSPEKPRTKRNPAEVVKATAEIYRYLPKETPADAGGLRKAMNLHLRILWALLNAKEVPQDPPVQLLQDFSARFSTQTQLFLVQTSGPELIPRHLVQIGTAMSAMQGRIAIQAQLVEQHMLSYIQACLSRFGLDRWCPDLRESAYSLYNSACRIVALDTFKQALVSHAYIHLGPNTTYATDMSVLIKMYDHFVFHYMRLRYLNERRNPGRVKEQLDANPLYQARKRLAAARLKFLVENNYPQRYRNLIDAKATSDDEYDPVQKAYVIVRRPERSEKVERFFRILDKKRKEAILQDRSRKWRERLRVEASPSEKRDTVFSALPDEMPIDYFDPEFFNQLQPRTRNRVAIRQVAMLEDVENSFTWNSEERMSDNAFTDKYGPTVFCDYQMVTDDEINHGDDEWDEDEDDEDDENMSDATERAGLSESEAMDDLESLSAARSSLSDHFSGSAFSSASR